MAPFFNREHGIFAEGNTISAWRLFGVNIMGGLVIIIWTSFWSVLLFWGLKCLNMLRIAGYDEFYGMDLTQHGESAYPASAWVEDQYTTGNEIQIGPIRNSKRNAEGEQNPQKLADDTNNEAMNPVFGKLRDN